LDLASPYISLIKPQSAYFEQFGSLGFEVLERVVRAAHERGLLVLLDGKRGDIDSTNEAYGRGLLGRGSPVGADALTVHAYLSIDALEPLIHCAVETGTTLFVVVRSSNASAWALQDARVNEAESVAEMLARQLRTINAREAPKVPLGAVVGATYANDAAGWRSQFGEAPLLAPGVGAQGADWDDIQRRFVDVLDLVIPSASRSVLLRGPNEAEFVAAIKEAATRARNLLEV
jgi:orotidine-5'-phosphate decarboxylase